MVLMSSTFGSSSSSPGPPPGINTPPGKSYHGGPTTTTAAAASSHSFFSPGGGGLSSTPLSSSSSRKQPRSSDPCGEDVDNGGSGVLENPLLSSHYVARNSGGYTAPVTGASFLAMNGYPKQQQRVTFSSSPTNRTSGGILQEHTNMNNSNNYTFSTQNNGGLRQRRSVTAVKPSLSTTRTSHSSEPAALLSKQPQPVFSKTTVPPPPPRSSLSLQTFVDTHHLPKAFSPSKENGHVHTNKQYHHHSFPSTTTAATAATTGASSSTAVSSSPSPKVPAVTNAPAAMGGGGGWVMVYGFTTLEQYEEVVRRFHSIGTVLQHKGGWMSGQSNWVAFQYASSLEVGKALGQTHCRLETAPGGSGPGIYCGVKQLQPDDPILLWQPHQHSSPPPIQPQRQQQLPSLFGTFNHPNGPSVATKAYGLTEKDILLNHPANVARAYLYDDDGKPKRGCCLQMLCWILNIQD